MKNYLNSYTNRSRARTAENDPSLPLYEFHLDKS